MKQNSKWHIERTLSLSNIRLLIGRLDNIHDEKLISFTQYFFFNIGYGKLPAMFNTWGFWFYIGGYDKVGFSRHAVTKTIGFSVPIYHKEIPNHDRTK